MAESHGSAITRLTKILRAKLLNIESQGLMFDSSGEYKQSVTVNTSILLYSCTSKNKIVQVYCFSLEQVYTSEYKCIVTLMSIRLMQKKTSSRNERTPF